jgi:hypothetical protein
MDHQASSNPLLLPPEVSPLEQEVLEEYERLAENMKKVKPPLSLSPLPSSYTNHKSKFFKMKHNKQTDKQTVTETTISNQVLSLSMNTARLRPRHHGGPADE